MRQFTSILACLFAIITVVNAQSSRTDTISGISTDTKSEEYQMESNGNKWFRGTKKNAFRIYWRYDIPENRPKPLMTANISYYGNGTLYWLNGINEIELAATGINAENASQFLYHVVANDSAEIVEWSSPKEFRTAGNITYAYLGKFDTRNKVLKLEMYKKQQYHDRSVNVFNNLFLPAATIQNLELNYNDRYLFRPHQQVLIPDRKQHRYFKEDWSGDRVAFHWSDSINHLSVKMKNTVQNDMYSIYLAREVNGDRDTAFVSNDWEMSYHYPDPFSRINASFFNQPGKYQVLIVPEPPDNFKIDVFKNAVSIPFTVLPSDITSFSGKQVVAMISGFLLVVGVLFFLYYTWQKRKVLQTAQEKEITSIELRSVRSQLNPHFIFNALAGIQNLINKGNTAAANEYLSRFARITRNVLDNSKNDMVTVSEEIRFLEDYLQMEQLRFGFNYSIHIDESIDKNSTELPSMLLQPFIENAVKHGVSNLKDKGNIDTSFKRENESLVIEVKDNGKGFDAEKKTNGFGWKLSEDRIQLLNRLYKGISMLLEKKSDVNGTLITIRLNQWF